MEQIAQASSFSEGCLALGHHQVEHSALIVGHHPQQGCTLVTHEFGDRVLVERFCRASVHSVIAQPSSKD